MEKDKAVKTGVLTFKDLDDPLVAMSFRAAVKADNMAIVLWEIVHNLRFRVNDLDEFMEKFDELMEEQHIVIDDLTG